ncbi:MAG: sugar ABC transporter permease [Caldilineaceae bacterium]
MALTTNWFGRLRPHTRAARKTLMGYLFISPFILGFLLWFVAPTITSIWMVFQDWNMMSPPRFIGLENFSTMFHDELFWQALKVTAIYTLLSIPLGTVLAFSVALLMNTKVRGINIFRTLYYLPVVVPAVAGSILWAWMLNTEFGFLNILLRAVGLPKVRWLVDPNLALLSLTLVSLWGIGSTMVIYLAGLQGVPELYYEAAEIDGAGRWAKLRHITIPLMSPVILFNLITGIIGSFQVFTAGYLITGGGPDNATLFYVLHIYRTGFKNFHMGQAAALSWVLFVIIVALVALIFKSIGGSIYYGGKEA